MKKPFSSILLLLAMLLGFGVPVRAGSEVVIVQSSNLRPYTEARLGAEKVLLSGAGGLHRKAVFPASLSTVFLDSSTDPAELRREIQRSRPDLLLAIGSQALVFAQGIPRVPVVYLMVPFPDTLITQPQRVTGVGLHVAPHQQFAQVRKLLPGARKVGVIYDPAKSSSLVAEARVDARSQGLELVARPAVDPRQVEDLLQEMAGEIDVFWMVPDQTVLTPQTLQHLLLFSLRSRTPLLTFSDKYVARGAALAVFAHPEDMGEQAGRMVLQILEGADIGAVLPQPAATVHTEVNRTVLLKMHKLVQRQTEQ